jgi:hypothetical protein
MLYLKLMTGKAMADNSSSHDFTLVEIPDGAQLDFVAPDTDPPITCGADTRSVAVRAIVTYRNGLVLEYALAGNAYVMNPHGKTIASRASY